MKRLKVHEGYVSLLTSKKEFESYFKSLIGGTLLTFDWETTGLEYDSTPLCLALHNHTTGEPVVVATDFFFSDGIPLSDIVDVCNDEFKRFQLVAHNAKFDSMINFMAGISDYNCNLYADTLIMIHLYNPDFDKNLEKRVKEDFNYSKKTFEEISGKKWPKVNWSLNGNELLELLAGYAGEDVYWETKMYNRYANLLDEELWAVHNNIEMPLVNILRDMKIRGVRIDVTFLKKMGEKVQPRLNELLESVYLETGCVFNLNSPKQKQEVFFDKMKLPEISKTKTGGRSTDAATMEAWADLGIPVGKMLTEYSTLQKLYTGYILAIPDKVDALNILRADFNSTGTTTGRFCIEENQRVVTLWPFTVKIKDLVPGSFVSCFDNNGIGTSRKILNVWNKGELKTVKVTYEIMDEKISLICTGNHSIRAENLSWVMAENLKCGDKIFGVYKNRFVPAVVLSIEDNGNSVCYDIEVDEFNNFVCEHINVHNSSANPNLQNQPNNKDFPVRKAFIPRKGYLFINYDYGQLELRVMAHMSKDAKFVVAFNNGEDPHGDTARRLGITRKQAKTVNFGVLYGLTKKGLAPKLGVTEAFAEKLIVEGYYVTYEGFTRWKIKTEQFAQQHGFVRNLFGRKRMLPEANRPKHLRTFKFHSAMRQAVNTRIQGSGADMVKIAMIKIANRFKEENLDAHLLLQVHDELLVEASIKDTRRAEQIMIEEMTTSVKLIIPVEVDGKVITNWAEMKEDHKKTYFKRSNFIPLIFVKNG